MAASRAVGGDAARRSAGFWSRLVEPQERSARVPDAPCDQRGQQGRAGHNRDDNEAADPRVEQRPQPESGADETNETPNERLHPEFPSVRLAGPEPGRKRVPNAGEHANQRPADRYRDEEYDAPQRAQDEG